MNKVLIVSSDKGFLHGLKADPRFAGYVLETTNDIDNLDITISSFMPDMLVVDFILNDSNGGAVCHQVKSDIETKHLPIILLSDYSGIGRFSTKFGCDALLQKPVDPYTLLRHMSNLLNTSAIAGHA